MAMLLVVSVCAGCKKQQQILPSLQSTAQPLPIPENRFEVRTDYSHLTPYVSPHTMYSRLSDGAMPELIPSNDYGILLPYASAVTLSNGGIRESKFGLVTTDGMLVTDLIYDSVQVAQPYSRLHPRYVNVYHQAYKLSVEIPNSGFCWSSPESINAACALDGSWVTPFDYMNIVFADEVFVAVRDYEKFDMDVFDYSGRRLYNTLDTDWVASMHQDASKGSLASNISEGYSYIRTRDGTYMFIEMLTGRAIYTDFVGASKFSHGLAAVQMRENSEGGYRGLWGYINKSFEKVIPMIYVSASTFNNEQAIVETQNGNYLVINKHGETMMTVPLGNHITENHYRHGYTVHDSDWDTYKCYSVGLVEIIPPKRIRDSEGEPFWDHFGGEWYICELDGGVWLFSTDEEYFYESVDRIFEVEGGYISYFIHRRPLSRYGVMTLDGRDVIPAQEWEQIDIVTDNGVVIAFIINTRDLLEFFDDQFIPSMYMLYDAEGVLITSGAGVLAYHEAVGLYSVLDEYHYSWLDKDGNVIISIPLMSYPLD